MSFETEHGHVDRILPWYANGSLDASARRDVAAHLENCASCREELKFLGDLRATLRASVAAEPVPPAAATSNGVESLPPSLRHRLRTAPRHHRPPLLAMAAGFVAAIGLGIALTVAGMNWLDAPRFRTATSGTIASPQHVQVVVRFAPDAEVGDITTLLRRYRATIVHGPDARDQWLLEIPTADAAQTRQLLPDLRATAGVEFAERTDGAEQPE